MNFTKILITGGAGFVGSNLATLFAKQYKNVAVTVFDNLKRRGSELTLTRLKDHGVRFVHGDIRCPEDFETLPQFDLVIDCSAEPSVHAGSQSSPLYVINTNLTGTINCLELARKHNAPFVFLSTSRVYPIKQLNALKSEEADSRYRWISPQPEKGFSAKGISEKFPLEGARSFYGACKLSSELMIEEYSFNYGVKAIINRCGVLTGPWQMGKVDQGIVALWMARHYFKKGLQYTGFGGTGKQVRDILHVEDLFKLLTIQLDSTEEWDSSVYNVGGGVDVSLSLLELTDLCQKITGNSIPIGSVPSTSPLDLIIYITDNSKVQSEFKWAPEKNPSDILEDIFIWIQNNESLLQPIFLD